MRVWAQLGTVALACQLGACGSDSTPPDDGGGPPPQLPLVQSGQLVWDGAFRLPHDNGDSTASFAFGSYALGYNSANAGLYVACHAEGHLVGEVSIPAPSTSATLSDLPIAQRLQPCADLTEGRISQIGGYPKWYMGGLLLSGGRLVSTAWSYFDADAATGATASHFTHSPTTSATGTVTGPHVFAGLTGGSQSGFVAGYMAEVPSGWQAALGGTSLSGQCCIPIIGRTSWGPNAFSFNAADLGRTSPVPNSPLVNYPQSEPNRPVTDWLAQSDFFNLSTFMAGMFIPSGTRSLLYLGRQGTGAGSYRSGVDRYCGDGLNAPPYQVQVWAYDLNDLAAVKAGTNQPNAVRTYARWAITGNETSTKLPWFNSCMYVRGLAFDPATNRIWIGSFPKAGQLFDGDYPIIHQFHVNTPSGAASRTSAALNSEGRSAITGTAADGSCVSSGASGCVSTTASEPGSTPEPVETFTTQDGVRVGVQVLATGLVSPSAPTSAPDGRLFVAERPGRVRMLENGVLLAAPMLTLTDAFTTGEHGLPALALHPSFASNHLLYVVYTAAGRNGTIARVVRYREVAGTLGEAAVLLDDVPSPNLEAGPRLRFGPDGRLYVTFGTAEPSVAQDLASFAGKILRLAEDGTTPSDNPFGSPVWSWGHRSPQGLDWHPVTRDLFAIEHGWKGHDEITVIDRGKNYSWPTIEGSKSRSGQNTASPFLMASVEPSGASFYRGSAFPAFRNDLFVAALRGKALLRVRLDKANPRHVVSVERLLDNRFGRLRDVISGADGLLYLVTNNREGGGTSAADDDRILRLIPLDP